MSASSRRVATEFIRFAGHHSSDRPAAMISNCAARYGASCPASAGADNGNTASVRPVDNCYTLVLAWLPRLPARVGVLADRLRDRGSRPFSEERERAAKRNYAVSWKRVCAFKPFAMALMNGVLSRAPLAKSCNCLSR